jgi:hypothetical protein
MCGERPPGNPKLKLPKFGNTLLATELLAGDRSTRSTQCRMMSSSFSWPLGVSQWRRSAAIGPQQSPPDQPELPTLSHLVCMRGGGDANVRVAGDVGDKVEIGDGGMSRVHVETPS